ncbi:MAG: hypothetical protein HY551_05015 [Elusimicrobia bacterium]|nr:hypothetical protein [Elusimicrobiota bacterium]
MIRISLILLSTVLAKQEFVGPDFAFASPRKESVPTPVSEAEVRHATATPKIILSEGALRHIRRRHFPKGPESAGKSAFFSEVDILALIRDAENVAPEREPFGRRLKRTVEASRPIGIDRATGRPTRLYTVITSAGGNLITAFPGTSGRPTSWRYSYPRRKKSSPVSPPIQP